MRSDDLSKGEIEWMEVMCRGHVWMQVKGRSVYEERLKSIELLRA